MSLSSKPEGDTNGPSDGESAITVSFASRKPGLIFLVGGVVFPFLVVVLEMATHICAEGFFDPVPTIWHAVIVSFVPFSNFVVWMVCRERIVSHLRLVVIANGVAIGIAAYYTLLFAPLLPLALIGILAGLGLLPMAPLFSLIAAIRGTSYLRSMVSSATMPRVKGTLLGVLIAIIAVVAADLPVTVTRIGMHMAASWDAGTRNMGLGWLRLVGNKDLMLRSCYQRAGVTTDLFSLVAYRAHPVGPEAARQIYYRVTGVAFTEEPQPDLDRRGRGPLWMPYIERAAFNANLGGSQVGGRNNALVLTASRLDGSVDADAALAYVQWTMEFRNDSFRQEEARAQIRLPSGGVVSRLTLWVDGEEREAAFAARDTVRKAYQKVVQRKRDPVLVTTRGPDQIQVQCFPVPPRGGTMKIRLGITAPTAVSNDEKALLHLPCFIERNFEVNEQASHQVWVESRQSLSSRLAVYAAEQPAPDLFSLRGTLRDQDLIGWQSTIEATRAKGVTRSWSEDETTQDGHVVIQNLEQRPEPVPETIVLVVDGSLRMSAYANQIADAMESLPEGVRFAAFIASDEPQEISTDGPTGSAPTYAAVARTLREFSYRGGCDNVPALLRACNLAGSTKNGAIVWIHGPQPEIMESPEVLRHIWERRPEAYRLYEVQASAGPNRIVEDMDGLQPFQRVERLSDVKKDLDDLFSRWRATGKRTVAVRERVAQGKRSQEEMGWKTSDHLTRLWANGEVRNLLASMKTRASDEAVKLASNYHLVTRVTGAVVLENQQQFQDAGLTPVDAAKVPTIPEPETWLLMAVLLLIFLWMTLNRRVRRCHTREV